MLLDKITFGRGTMPMLCIGFVILFALDSPANAQPIRSLLQRVAQSHPAIISQHEQSLASEATVAEARSGYLPRVGTSASYGYQERERSGGLGSNGETDSKPLDFNLTISQNVFEGFRTEGAIDSAEAALYASSHRYTATRQQIFLESINAYIQLIRQQHLLQLSQQNIQTLQHQVAMEQERMMAGTGISVDVLLAKSRLQQAHERYAGFLGAFHEAEATFEQFFGMKPDYRTLRLPSVAPAAMPRQEAQAIQTALLNNPSLKQTEAQADSAYGERKIARAGYFPSVDVVASSNYNDASDDITGETTSNALQLRGSWELFSGFADKARETRAIHNYQSTLATAQNAQRQVIENTKRAWTNLITTQQRAQILQNAVSIAQQVYAARQRLRDIGSETAINVLDAENELFSSQINAVSAQYDSYISSFRLLQAMGMLEISSVL